MPILEKLFDSIGDSNIFIIVDLRQGFNQIMFTTKDRKKSTFHGSNKLCEWLVMPFGLKNAHVFFQQVMDQVLKGVDFLKCYIDGILVHSKGFLQHLAHLEVLFKKLHEVKMKIHVRQLLSLYFRFYKVTMLESTNATGEGRMRMYFQMLDCVRS